jgi:hypothetical protein
MTTLLLLAHKMDRNPFAGVCRHRWRTPVWPPEELLVVRGATEVEILKIVKQIRGDAGDEKLDAPVLENGQIIESVRREGL